MLNFLKGKASEFITNIGINNTKVLVKNFLSLSGLQFISYFFPLLTIPYLTRTISIEHFGYISLANASILYFATIIDFGFMFSATKMVAENRNNPEKLSQIVSNVVIAKALLSVISFGALIILIYSVDVFFEIRILMFLFFLLNTARICSLDWLFQGMEAMEFITIFSIITRTVFVVLIFCVIRSDPDYIFYPVLLGCGDYLSEGISWLVAMKKFKIRIVSPKLNEVFCAIKQSFDIFISQISHTLYSTLSLSVMGSICGPTSNAIYDAAYKIVAALHNILLTLSRTWFPFLARNKDKHYIYAFITISISLISTILLSLMSEFIISIIYPTEYKESIEVLRVLAFMPLGLAFVNVYGINFLIIHNKQSLMRTITLSTSIIGFLVSIVLVKYFSYMGVTYAIVGTTWVCGLFMYISSKFVTKRNSKCRF